MDKKEPEILLWNGMRLVRISDVEGFKNWLYGQTLPLVDDNPDPWDWAYEWDYLRYIRGLPVID